MSKQLSPCHHNRPPAVVNKPARAEPAPDDEPGKTTRATSVGRNGANHLKEESGQRQPVTAHFDTTTTPDQDDNEEESELNAASMMASPQRSQMSSKAAKKQEQQRKKVAKASPGVIFKTGGNTGNSPQSTGGLKNILKTSNTGVRAAASSKTLQTVFERDAPDPHHLNRRQVSEREAEPGDEQPPQPELRLVHGEQQRRLLEQLRVALGLRRAKEAAAAAQADHGQAEAAATVVVVNGRGGAHENLHRGGHDASGDVA